MNKLTRVQSTRCTISHDRRVIPQRNVKSYVGMSSCSVRHHNINTVAHSGFHFRAFHFVVPVSILWFRFPFCGSGFHFVVPVSILQILLPFCRSAFRSFRYRSSVGQSGNVRSGCYRTGEARLSARVLRIFICTLYGVRTSRVFYKQRVYLTNVLSAEEVRRVSFGNTIESAWLHLVSPSTPLLRKRKGSGINHDTHVSCWNAWHFAISNRTLPLHSAPCIYTL